MALCAEMLVLGKLATTETEARAKLQAALDSRRSRRAFRAHGDRAGRPGRPGRQPDKHLDKAPIVVPVPALQSATQRDRLPRPRPGGGQPGRRPPPSADPIDFAVGLTDLVELGEKIDKGQPLAMVHARTGSRRAGHAPKCRRPIASSEPPAAPTPSIYRTIRPVNLNWGQTPIT
jgi:thymidine phosphorylase